MRARTAVRLVAFLVIGGVMGAMEFNTLTGPHVGTTDSYHAIFGGTDGVSGLRAGNPVRVAGVAVGKVTGISLVDARHAEVTFTANRNQPITTRTWAVVRYANLLGQRYLALDREGTGHGDPLPPGGTIPQRRTAPALSLTALFDGFRPLFSALSPQQVNALSQDIVAVLQGESGRVDDLVSRVADLSANLAQRNHVFSSVLDSLATLLSTVSHHDDQLANMVTALHALADRLHRDGPGIASSLSAVDQLIGSVGGLLGKLEEHGLPADIADARTLTGRLAANTPTLQRFIAGFTSAFQTFDRISQNGNWLNTYLCNVRVHTYGWPSVTVGQEATSLTDFLNGAAPGLGSLVGNILQGLGVKQQLKTLKSIKTPLRLPNGRVGITPSHTAVCR